MSSMELVQRFTLSHPGLSTTIVGTSSQAHLAGNDAYSAFSALGDLIVTGPTLTNVNDFRAILVPARSN